MSEGWWPWQRRPRRTSLVKFSCIDEVRDSQCGPGGEDPGHVLSGSFHHPPFLPEFTYQMSLDVRLPPYPVDRYPACSMMEVFDSWVKFVRKSKGCGVLPRPCCSR